MARFISFPDLFNSNKADAVERLKLLYGNAIGGLGITLLCMAVMCFAFEHPEKATEKLWFFVCLLVSHSMRLADILYFQSKIRTNTLEVTPAIVRFSLGTFVNSSIWASYVFVVMPTMSQTELTATVMIVSAIAGGTITIFSPSTVLSVFYTGCLLLPSAYVVLLREEEFFSYLALLAVVFWVVMLLSAKKVGLFFTQVLALKRENAQMLNLVEREKKQVERANSALQQANQQLDEHAHELESRVQARTQEIYRLSNIDALTQLSNRNAFIQQLYSLLNKAKEEDCYTLVFIDLVGFKQINDGLGHNVGDQVLREISKRLESIQKSRDGMLCRWGGDEFLLLVNSCSKQDMALLTDQLQGVIQQPLTASSILLSVNASIGLSCFPQDTRDAEKLIQYADIAMYHHKKYSDKQHLEQSAIFFNDQLFNQLKLEQLITEGLKHAIEREEFGLVFQPIIDLKNNRVWACEALLRWNHGGKHVGPDQFIPIAEKTGYIASMGAWVLKEACKVAATWKHDEDISLSVNVSPLQLLNENFIHDVQYALAVSKLPANRLHLEITESVMLERGEDVSNLLKMLSDIGVHISIDDFGTGYSSLNQLDCLHFDVIKIDKSFSKNVSSHDVTIISAAKLIADDFGASTVAEGIETEDELNVLTQIGINLFQGYLFAKPMDAEQLEVWYKAFDTNTLS